MTRALWATLATAGLILLHDPAMAEEPTWIRVDTPNLDLLTTGNAAAAAEAVVELESLRTFFRGARPSLATGEGRPRIVAFSSEWEFHAFRANSYSPAYFAGGPGQDLIVLGRLAKENFPALRHEYVHYLLKQSGWTPPVWLAEGLADYFGGIPADTARLRVARLRRDSLVPLAELMSVTSSSAWYREQALAVRFYAQSWALVDMLMTDPAYRDRVWDYLDGCRAGANPAESLRAIFGKSSAEIERDLKEHLRGIRPAEVARCAQSDASPVVAAARTDEVDSTLSVLLERIGGTPVAAVPYFARPLYGVR